MTFENLRVHNPTFAANAGKTMDPSLNNIETSFAELVEPNAIGTLKTTFGFFP